MKKERCHSNIKKKKLTINQFFVIFTLVVLLLLLIYPIYLVLIKSVKTPTQDLYHPFTITFPFNFENYSFAMLYVKNLFGNTLILACANTIGTLIFSTIMAYAFVRFEFPCKEAIFLTLLAVMMIPGSLTLIAQYVLVDELGIMYTRWAVILPQIAGNIPFNLFLLRTFFNGIPKDIYEAATIDGAKEFTLFVKITLPLSKAIIATAGIMLIMQSWNDLIWPMMVLNEQQYTISTGLVPFTNEYFKLTGSYGAPMAGYIIVSIPLIVLFLFTSKQFIAGLTSGAFKM